MTKLFIQQRVILSLVAAAASATGCTKEEGRRAQATTGAPDVEAQALIAQVGAEPGPLERREGPAALLASITEKVELRRLGEETFSDARTGAFLYAGDQVRVGEQASASIVFADESTVQVAEGTTLAIGSRVATADPASSAAVLSGVARFSVSPRVPGEGSFLVFTPAGIVATKGTVFGVGVAADGDARVGVESGEVAVAGRAAFDVPVSVGASSAVELAAAGTLTPVAPWSEDDWGSWRDRAEAGLDLSATADLHVAAMAALATHLNTDVAALDVLGKQVVAFEAEAALAATQGDAARYSASLPTGIAAIDASFLTALRLEWANHAYLAHALLAADLHVRHPEVVAFASLAPHVHSAVLWPKRLDAVAVAYLEPLRAQYYLHHPRGRVQAQFVGITPPAFYADIALPELPAANAKLTGNIFVPPLVVPVAGARPVWIAAPSTGWHATARATAAAPRGKAAFWVRPPQLRAKAILGVDVKTKLKPYFDVRAPGARAQANARWNVSLGTKIKLPSPDLRAAAKARLAFQGSARAPDLEAHADADANLPELRAKAKLEAPDVKAKLKLEAPDVKAKLKLAGDAKAKASANVKVAAGAKAQLDQHIKAGAAVKVKLPTVRPPTVKASVKGSAKLSAGF